MHHNPDTPWVLVGTKLDTRENPEVLSSLRASNLEPITTEKVFTLAIFPRYEKLFMSDLVS